MKNQKIKKSKPLTCNTNKLSLEIESLPKDMTRTTWRSMQGVKDETLIMVILSHVRSSELSINYQ